ncbi:MAG: glycosyltransferase, partial [Chloroflexi bacterium]|nr:glycosyltransferase [Chloroflexota bacterium]
MRNLFRLCVGVIGYVYVGYPALLWLMARFRQRPVRQADVTPNVTIAIAAYNGEKTIAGRIENCLALDYPPDRLELLVGSDGSTDRTVEIVGRYANRGVRLLQLERQGKALTDNALVEAATDDADGNSIAVPEEDDRRHGERLINGANQRGKHSAGILAGRQFGREEQVGRDLCRLERGVVVEQVTMNVEFSVGRAGANESEGIEVFFVVDSEDFDGFPRPGGLAGRRGWSGGRSINPPSNRRVLDGNLGGLYHDVARWKGQSNR